MDGSYHQHKTHLFYGVILTTAIQSVQEPLTLSIDTEVLILRINSKDMRVNFKSSNK